jgi:hypothetical protein
MRELHRLEKASVYKQAVIRVQFPDQTVVQGCFHPDEPIGNVYDWVASCLHSPLPFFLFTSYVVGTLLARCCGFVTSWFAMVQASIRCY